MRYWRQMIYFFRLLTLIKLVFLLAPPIMPTSKQHFLLCRGSSSNSTFNALSIYMDKIPLSIIETIRNWKTCTKIKIGGGNNGNGKLLWPPHLDFIFDIYPFIILKSTYIVNKWVNYINDLIFFLKESCFIP